MRIAWATDIHLNFLTPSQLDAFCAEAVATGAEALVVSGDISEAPALGTHLRSLVARTGRPLYFVLGNHDFYHGSIASVRALARTLLHEDERIVWLPAVDSVALGAETALVGHDGWGDARLGNYQSSPILLNDFFLIEELASLGHAQRLAMLRRLGNEAAAHLHRTLPAALARRRQVIVLLHVPPFREACWHEGRISDDDWLPYFTCHAAGQALLEIARAHADRTITVLCGHTHGQGSVRMLPNLVVETGGAEYGAPRIQSIIQVS
jgi:predicted MPP superfamily phosphohydrolase